MKQRTDLPLVVKAIPMSEMLKHFFKNVHFMIAGILDDVIRDCLYDCRVSTLMSTLNSHNSSLLFFLPFGNQGLGRGSDLFRHTQ